MPQSTLRGSTLRGKPIRRGAKLRQQRGGDAPARGVPGEDQVGVRVTRQKVAVHLKCKALCPVSTCFFTKNRKTRCIFGWGCFFNQKTEIEIHFLLGLLTQKQEIKMQFLVGVAFVAKLALQGFDCGSHGVGDGAQAVGWSVVRGCVMCRNMENCWY